MAMAASTPPTSSSSSCLRLQRPSAPSRHSTSFFSLPPRFSKAGLYVNHSCRQMAVRISASTVITQDELKKMAADKAVEYVESGMVLGLGTGSTAAFVVSRIGQLLKEGKLKNIVGVPTSKIGCAANSGASSLTWDSSLCSR